jgi:hypothetical protein
MLVFWRETYMSNALRRSRLLIALVASVALLGLSLVGPSAASADWANFCNPKTLPGYGNCTGAFRNNLSQVFGWGDQHRVCVSITGTPGAAGIGWRCSSGPGDGVYTPQYEGTPAYPFIANGAAGTNTVHGVALFP